MPQPCSHEAYFCLPGLFLITAKIGLQASPFGIPGSMCRQQDQVAQNVDFRVAKEVQAPVLAGEEAHVSVLSSVSQVSQDAQATVLPCRQQFLEYIDCEGPRDVAGPRIDVLRGDLVFQEHS